MTGGEGRVAVQTAGARVDSPVFVGYWLMLSRWLSRNRLILNALGVVLAIVFWDLSTRIGLVPVSAVSRPMDVLDVAIIEFERGDVLSDLLVTLREVWEGLFFAIIVGTILGLAIGRSRDAWIAFEWPLVILNGLPIVALSPVLILVVGITIEAKVIVSFIAGVVPITWNAATGSQSVPATLIQSARVYGCNPVTMVTKILLPASIPYIMTGIRLAVGRSLVAVLVAELYVSSEGLGRWIRLAGNTLSPDLLMFVALLTAFTGIVFIQFAAFVERRFERWKEDMA